MHNQSGSCPCSKGRTAVLCAADYTTPLTCTACAALLPPEQIATALDAILARQLGDAQATQQQPPAAAAAAVEHSPGSAPAAAPSSAAETALDDADISDVRLFRGVAPGTPCVIQSNEYGGSSSSVYGLQHPPKAAAAGQVHLHPAWGAQRPFRSIRAMIPRLNLAETSSSGSKKRHAAAMQMLSVDGAALLAAAGKAETAWKQLQQLQEQQQEQQQQEQGKKKKKKKSGVLTHAMIQAWQGMRKTKVEGVVLEAKQFVPYETRIAKLLGQQNTGSKDTATAAIASS